MAVAWTLEAFLNGVWTDLTADRAHGDGAPWTIIGGGSGAGPGDVVAGGGSLTFELNNDATNSGGVRGWYSPNAMAPRPFWGLGVSVRLSVTIGANPTYYRFQGWVDQIVPRTGLLTGQRTVQVVAVDWLAISATALAAGVAAQAGQRGDQLVATLAGLVTPAPAATSYDVGTDTYLYALDDIDPSSSRVLGALANVARSGLDRVYIKGNTSTGGVLRFEAHGFRRTLATNAYVLSDVAAGGLGLSGIDTAKRRADQINQLRFTIHPRKVDPAAVVLYAENIDASTAVSIPPAGGSITIWATYVDPTQTAQQIACSPGTGVAPVATTDYLFNSAANGSGTNLTASVTVAATFFGTTAKLVITNNHATLAAFRTFLQLRGKGIYGYQDVTAEAVNTASQTAVGPTLVAQDMPYQSVIGQAQAAVDYFVGLYTSSAWTQIDSVQAFCPADDETSLWLLIQTEVSTAFAVTETMSGLANYPLWVNGYQIDISERDHLTFTFHVEPRDPQQYWVLGAAGFGELGNTTFLGPF